MKMIVVMMMMMTTTTAKTFRTNEMEGQLWNMKWE